MDRDLAAVKSEVVGVSGLTPCAVTGSNMFLVNFGNNLTTLHDVTIQKATATNVFFFLFFLVEMSL